MQMKEKLEKLKSLQDVLAERYEIESKVEALPKRLIGNTESLERERKEYIQKNSEYENEKNHVNELKASLEEITKSREENEKNMDNIQTHREYEILEKQISDAQEQENSIRKELLREEKRLSELNDILEEKKSSIDFNENELNKTKASQEQELATYNAKLEELKSQETDVSDGIEQEILIKFQRIIKRNRKGIVAVKGNVCDGCHMILPAQFANEVHRGEKILFCPYCSRILFYEESTDDSNFFSLEDSGNLLGEDDEDKLLEDEDFDEDGENLLADESLNSDFE